MDSNANSIESLWRELTEQSFIDTKTLPLAGQNGLRALMLAIGTLFSVKTTKYTVSNSREVKARIVPYDESDEDFLLRFHRENFNRTHPPTPDCPDLRPFDKERDNSWATSWSRLVKAELISRCNDVPAKLHHELKREPTKDEIKAARDALYQESRTATFVPESFGIHDPRDWMHGIAHGIKFDFTAEHEYERDENGRIKTKGAKKRKVIVPGKSTYHFGFTIPLIENGKKTGTVVARPTFDEAMEVAMAQEYKLEKHAELCSLPMYKGFSKDVNRFIGLTPKHARWAREAAHVREETVRVLTELGYDSEEKRAAHCEEQERNFIHYWLCRMTHTVSNGEGVTEATAEVRNIWSQFRVCYNTMQKGQTETPKMKGKLCWQLDLDNGKATLLKLVKASNGKARRIQQAQVSAPKGGGGGKASRSNAFAMLEVDPEETTPGATTAAAAPVKTMAQRASEHRPEQEAKQMAKRTSKLTRRKAGEKERKQAKAKADAKAKACKKKCRHGMDCFREGCYFVHPEGWCPVAAKERHEAAKAQESAPAAEEAAAAAPAESKSVPTEEEMRREYEMFQQQQEMAEMRAQLEEMKKLLAQQTKAVEKRVEPVVEKTTPTLPSGPKASRSAGFTPAWMS